MLLHNEKLKFLCRPLSVTFSILIFFNMQKMFQRKNKKIYFNYSKVFAVSNLQHRQFLTNKFYFVLMLPQISISPGQCATKKMCRFKCYHFNTLEIAALHNKIKSLTENSRGYFKRQLRKAQCYISIYSN